MLNYPVYKNIYLEYNSYIIKNNEGSDKNKNEIINRKCYWKLITTKGRWKQKWKNIWQKKI